MLVGGILGGAALATVDCIALRLAGFPCKKVEAKINASESMPNNGKNKAAPKGKILLS